MTGLSNWTVRIVAALVAVYLAGCANTNVKKAEALTINWTSSSKRVVLVDPDVTLGELMASGAVEPRADWTQSAKSFIAKGISDDLATRNVELVHADHLTNPREVQLAKLHGAVGKAVLTHVYFGAKLPHKSDALDWTIGSGANDLRSHYGADYALFVFVHDTYTSAGRAAMMVGAAILGVAVQGGQQIGFASLVDLRTGNIAWFNFLASGTGDLREEEPAKAVVANLVKDLPL